MLRAVARCTPVNLPLLDFKVLSADVDFVGSMMEGMTIVLLAPSVLSFPSAATPAASVLPTGVPFFTSRSGGPRGDMSVLSGFTAPAVLSGRRSLYCGNRGGEAWRGESGCTLAPMLGASQTGILGGGWSVLRDHPRLPRVDRTRE